nr:hypothetical protein CFP56_27839 [Quercus suber]
MTTRFNKQKLAESQEKKAKGGLVSGLLSRKRLKAGDVSKDDPIVTSPSAHSPAKRPVSFTSSLEVIGSVGEEAKKKKKVAGKSFLLTFWDDANAAALKAHEALSVDDRSPLMAKSSSEVMSSYIQKLVHVYFDNALGESLFISRKLLDFEKKVAIVEPMIKSLSAKNETLKNKVTILAVEAENDKENVAALEKSPQEFKDSDSYSDELCEYYVGGFKLLRKWMAKHHPNLDLSGLVMGDVEKELLFDRPSEATAENVMEKATTIAEVIKEVAPVTPADPTPDEQ